VYSFRVYIIGTRVKQKKDALGKRDDQFFHVASMTFDKRCNKIEMKRNMEIRDYRMRPADLGAKRVHAVPREGPRRER